MHAGKATIAGPAHLAGADAAREGPFLTVVGLPLDELLPLLRELGFEK